MRQSAVGRAVGMVAISIFVAIIVGLVQLIRYVIATPKRKECKRLLEESMRISPDNKKMCIYCKKFTDDEVDKGVVFCIECGRQRGVIEV
jgi:hypothetical protein